MNPNAIYVSLIFIYRAYKAKDGQNNTIEAKNVFIVLFLISKENFTYFVMI